MNKSRIWIALTAVWLCVLSNMGSFDFTFNVGSFVFAVTAGLVALVTLVPQFRKVSTAWVVGASVATFFAAKWSTGHELAGTALSLTMIEAAVVCLTIGLVRRILTTIDELEIAADETASMEMPDCTAFETSQGEIYREVRRARQFERPLSLLTIAPTDESVRQAEPRLVREIRANSVANYVRARIADVLTKEMLPSDLIARRNGHFVVLVPEADQQRMDEIVSRLKETTKEELGIDVNVGSASFPDQEITFVGLLERAESSMKGRQLRMAAAAN